MQTARLVAPLQAALWPPQSKQSRAAAEEEKARDTRTFAVQGIKWLLFLIRHLEAILVCLLKNLF